MLLIDEARTPTEVLMESLAKVEGAKRVVILIERDEAIHVNSNCSYRDLKWILDQGEYVVMAELFDVQRGDR